MANTKGPSFLKSPVFIASGTLTLFAGFLGCALLCRTTYGNFRVVIPDKVYRSAQPNTTELREWTERYGIKTVINLRGSESKDVAREEKIAKELGLKMVNLNISAQRLPARWLLLELLKTIESAEPPMLIHCRSGFDRAGTASTLAAMVVGGQNYEKAKWQAYVPTGPWKRRKHKNRKYFSDYSHISDLLCYYEKYCKQNSLKTNDLNQFKEWIERTAQLPEKEPQ